MSNENSSRVIGAVIVLIGVFLTGLNGFLVLRNGEFYGFAAVIGPTALAYGLSIIVRPPEKMPQTELKTIHKVSLQIGFFLGLIYFLVLKFVDVRKLFNG